MDAHALLLVRTVVSAAALLVAPACSGGDGGEPVRAERVILLTCDTLRADRLGVYGYERDVSPRLDELARECVVFEEAYSSAPMTQPAVSSLLSGRLPSEVGAEPGNLALMPADVLTLAERVRAAGLASGAVVSNWILRRPPPDQGDVGVQQGFGVFDDRMPTKETNRSAVRERVAADTTDAAIRLLEKRKGDAFLLWVHYQDPHGPYTPPPEYAGLFSSPRGVEPPVPLGDTVLGRGRIPSYQVLGGEQDPAVYRDLYDAEIRYFDAELGRLVDWLRAHGLLDGALLVFTADHGEALGEHGYWFCHGESVHREIVRVPLLVRWPDGRVPASYAQVEAGRSGSSEGADGVRRCERLASHLDVVPTVLHALDLAAPDLRGVSLLAEPPPEGRVLPQDLWPSAPRPRWWAASDGRYRLIWSEAFEGERLFDVRADPGEEHDLAADEPRRVAELAAAHEAFHAAGERLDGTRLELSEGERDDMRDLGYVDGHDG